nr:hypothetical protein [Polymorphobacter sp.]
MSLLKTPFGNKGSGTSAGEDFAGATVDGLVRSAAAQRVRVGLTGLAAIFLLVMIAAAGLKPAQSVAPADSQGEPLAVLGVAPGAGPATYERAPGQAPPVSRASRI